MNYFQLTTLRNKTSRKTYPLRNILKKILTQSLFRTYLSIQHSSMWKSRVLQTCLSIKEVSKTKEFSQSTTRKANPVNSNLWTNSRRTQPYGQNAGEANAAKCHSLTTKMATPKHSTTTRRLTCRSSRKTLFTTKISKSNH